MGSFIPNFQGNEAKGWISNTLFLSQNNDVSSEAMRRNYSKAGVDSYGKILGYFLWRLNMAEWKGIQGSYYYLSKSSYQQWLNNVSAAHWNRQEITLKNIANIANNIKVIQQYSIDTTSSIEDDVRLVFRSDIKEYQEKFFNERLVSFFSNIDCKNYFSEQTASIIVDGIVNGLEGSEAHEFLFFIIEKVGLIKDDFLKKFCKYLFSNKLISQYEVIYNQLSKNPLFLPLLEPLEDEKNFLENLKKDVATKTNESAQSRKILFDTLKKKIIDYIFTNFRNLNIKDFLLSIDTITKSNEIPIDKDVLLEELKKLMIDQLDPIVFNRSLYEKLAAEYPKKFPKLNEFLRLNLIKLKSDLTELRLNMDTLHITLGKQWKKQKEKSELAESSEFESDIMIRDENSFFVNLEKITENFKSKQEKLFTISELTLSKQAFIDKIKVMIVNFIEYSTALDIKKFLQAAISSLKGLITEDILIEELKKHMIKKSVSNLPQWENIYKNLQSAYPKKFSKEFLLFLQLNDVILEGQIKYPYEIVSSLKQKLSFFYTIANSESMRTTEVEMKLACITEIISELYIDYFQANTSHSFPMTKEEEAYIHELNDLMHLVKDFPKSEKGINFFDQTKQKLDKLCVEYVRMSEIDTNPVKHSITRTIEKAKALKDMIEKPKEVSSFQANEILLRLDEILQSLESIEDLQANVQNDLILGRYFSFLKDIISEIISKFPWFQFDPQLYERITIVMNRINKFIPIDVRLITQLVAITEKNREDEVGEIKKWVQEIEQGTLPQFSVWLSIKLAMNQNFKILDLNILYQRFFDENYG